MPLPSLLQLYRLVISYVQMLGPSPSPTKRVEIGPLDLNVSVQDKATITDVQHLASYNWVEAPTPTIIVPGCPPRWSPPIEEKAVKKESGLLDISQNAARHPESPLEPLFRALYRENPSFTISAIDVVTDRNNIRKLLSFLSPRFLQNGLKPFTIDVELIGKTAVFCLQETATNEVPGLRAFKGYGHQFEKAATTDQIPDSIGHHRIISYEFGGLKFLVRHETDAFVADASFSFRDDPESTDDDDLSNKLDTLDLSPYVGPEGSQLTVKRGGHVVSLKSTLEIKIQASHRPLDMSNVLPHLWVSQTSKLVYAYHKKGVFPPPEVSDVGFEVKRWEQLHQWELKKLAVLIRKILSVVRVWNEGVTIRYDQSSDQILLTPRTSKREMLPKDLYSKWEKD